MSRSALPDLPVREALPALLAALAKGTAAVLVAPPGAGKTTLVPLALLDAAWRGDGRILLLEPRRLAARAAARRMAALVGEEPGGLVGYAMRMDQKVSARTRILVVTEGVLARMILDDPELPGIAAVIFDEFHERSLDGDFGLALALDVAGALRPDLRLLVMSATLDGARVARLLGDAPVVESEGRAFPVEIRHEPRAPDARIEEAVAKAIRAALAAEPGSVLAFLPGQREIERTAEALAGRLPSDVNLMPLYGQLDSRAQDAAIRPAAAGRRKVVLATSIAETSITIDGVRVVIDAGLSRQPRYEPATGLTRLETVRVSRASAAQRAGRAGRTQPGIAIRLWQAGQTAGLQPFDPPEILQADLSGLLLDCAAFGVADPLTLRFLDPPPGPALAEARALLVDLGALDDAGRLTEAGQNMRRLALPARLAHMVAEASADGEALAAAELAMLLTERGLGGTGIDLDERLRRFRADRGPRATDARRLAERIAQSLPSPFWGGSDPQVRGGGGSKSASALNDPHPAHFVRDPPHRREGKASALVTPAGPLLIHAFPDRVARARGAGCRYLLANGRGATLNAADALAREPFLVVADLVGSATNARIVAAAAISEEVVRAGLAHRIERRAETRFDPERGALRARETVRLGAIVLGEGALPPPTGATADAALIAALREHGLALPPFEKETRTLRRRLAWLHKGLGEPWPDMSDATLVATLDDWLAPFLTGASSMDTLAPVLTAALLSAVPHDLQRKLDALAPTHFEAPSGSRVPIRYEEDEPVLAIRVQELFGLDRHPSIANGTVPLTLELLSPAHRPIQTTRDLPGFWRGSWTGVRASLRGRYPRHSWPENPLEAQATSRAKPRGT